MSRYPLVDLINRERDAAYREHLREEHDFDSPLLTEADLEDIALHFEGTCSACEQYALSVGVEEGT